MRPIANLPVSANIEDRRDNEPGEADMARARAAYVVGRKGMFRRA
jgi:hypothetical protein